MVVHPETAHETNDVFGRNKILLHVPPSANIETCIKPEEAALQSRSDTCSHVRDNIVIVHPETACKNDVFGRNNMLLNVSRNTNIEVWSKLGDVTSLSLSVKCGQVT